MPIANDNRTLRPARLIVVMGVTGCGKSTVGAALAGRLNTPFLDADDYHPPANVAKMSKGIPLTDDDRWPWLDSLATALPAQADRRGLAVSGCSALRRAYRQRLIATAGEDILFVFLQGSPEIIGARLAARADHFMPPALLTSQFETLEPPEADENAIAFDVGPPVLDLAEAILRQLADIGVRPPPSKED